MTVVQQHSSDARCDHSLLYQYRL